MRVRTWLGVLVLVTAWGHVARAEQPARATSLSHPSFDPLGKPTFLSFGPIATFANPEARGTFGGELTLVRWLNDEPDLGFAGYTQAEYVAGGTGRVSFGSQINYAGFGIETGYAYQRLLEDKFNQHSIQLTPFLSWGVMHIGCRVLVPIAPRGAPVAMFVMGLKAPINIGKKIEVRPRMHWLGG